jgi:hypothetical protein
VKENDQEKTENLTEIEQENKTFVKVKEYPHTGVEAIFTYRAKRNVIIDKKVGIPKWN